MLHVYTGIRPIQRN